MSRRQSNSTTKYSILGGWLSSLEFICMLHTYTNFVIWIKSGTTQNYWNYLGRDNSQMQNVTFNLLSDSTSHSYIITSSGRVGVSASCRESSHLRVKLSQNIYKKVMCLKVTWFEAFFDHFLWAQSQSATNFQKCFTDYDLKPMMDCLYSPQNPSIKFIYFLIWYLFTQSDIQ